MFSLLLTNLALFAGLLLLFIGSYAANILLGTFYNTSQLQQMFEKDRLMTGIKRGGVVLAGLVLLIVIISLLPGMLTVAGLTEIVPLVSDLTVVSIAGIIATATVKYTKGAIQKLYKIITGEDYPVKDGEAETEAAEGGTTAPTESTEEPTAISQG